MSVGSEWDHDYVLVICAAVNVCDCTADGEKLLGTSLVVPRECNELRWGERAL